jgi:predicted pyridoxine 5'-phosphate oxidase superfamily flavin-nucleotide-binding protein
VNDPDDNVGLTQAILLSIDEAYFHCPRSMRFARLWDTDTIEKNRNRSIKDLKTDATTA